jgi:hypothetical protein
MHCAACPTRSSIGRLSHSQLQSVWVSLWAWPAVPLLQAPRERPADRPAAERRDDLTAFQSPLMLSVADWSGSRGEREPPSIPTVEITNLRRTTLMNEDRVIGNAKKLAAKWKRDSDELPAA